jgi:hypothetical protein
MLVPLINTVLLLGGPILPIWCVKISTYLHLEPFLLITYMLLILDRIIIIIIIVNNLVTFLDFLTPVVRGQHQTDAIYFDLSNAFDLVPHNMLLHKLNSFGYSDAYVSWFHSCLTNR